MTIQESAALAPPARSTAPAKARDGRHLGAAVAISAAVYLGFWFTYLFVVAGMAHDHARERRVHPAYQIGLLVCVAVEVAVWLLTPTPAGRVLAQGLAWVGRAAGFLY